MANSGWIFGGTPGVAGVTVTVNQPTVITGGARDAPAGVATVGVAANPGTVTAVQATSPPYFLRWTFYDPYTAELYTFPMNGREGGEPAIKKNVSSQRTCAPDGRRIHFEGARSPQPIVIQGVVRSQAHRNELQAWADKPYQILWTNDFGEQRWIWIHTFTPERKRVGSRRYKASYDLQAFVLDIP